MKGKSTKTKEIKEIKAVSAWLSNLHEIKITRKNILSVLSDGIILNKTLTLMPEAELTTQDYLSPVISTEDKQKNFEVFKTTCIKKLNIKEEDIFPYSIFKLNITDISESNESLRKLKKTLLKIAEKAVENPHLQEKMDFYLILYILRDKSFLIRLLAASNLYFVDRLLRFILFFVLVEIGFLIFIGVRANLEYDERVECKLDSIDYTENTAIYRCPDLGNVQRDYLYDGGIRYAVRRARESLPVPCKIMMVLHIICCMCYIFSNSFITPLRRLVYSK